MGEEKADREWPNQGVPLIMPPLQQYNFHSSPVLAYKKQAKDRPTDGQTIIYKDARAQERKRQRGRRVKLDQLFRHR